jgi:hypothetical protein
MLLKSFLELKVLGAFASGLGLNSFESCLYLKFSKKPTQEFDEFNLEFG